MKRNRMTLERALNIVLNLANQGVLSCKDADTDELIAARHEQNDAIYRVGQLLKVLDK